METVSSGIHAEYALALIKSGQRASLSYAQVSNMIVNLQDAQRNLSEEKFEAVFALWKSFQDNQEKVVLNNINDYYSMAIEIIKQFDGIAPYEKYSGGNEQEYSVLMKAIRNESAVSIDDKICRKCGNQLHNRDKYCGKCGAKYSNEEEESTTNSEQIENNALEELEEEIQKTAEPGYSKEERVLLDAIEHDAFYRIFFDNPLKLLAITNDREKLTSFLMGIYKKENIDFHYSINEFKSTTIPFVDKTMEQIITFPNPICAPLCKKIILFFNFEHMDKLAYFTVEKSFSGYMLCGWDSEGIHLNYGDCTLEDAHIRALVIYCDLYGIDKDYLTDNLSPKSMQLFING